MQLAQAALKMFDSGYVHNDIHTGNTCLNLLANGDPVLTLIDFGLTTKIGEFVKYQRIEGAG